MEFALGRGIAAAAWLRRPGAGTLERAHRKISAACGTRQFSDLPAFERRAILSFTAPSGLAALAKTANRVHSKKHVASPGCGVTDRGFRAAALLQCVAGCGCDASETHPAVHGKNRARTAR